MTSWVLDTSDETGWTVSLLARVNSAEGRRLLGRTYWNALIECVSAHFAGKIRLVEVRWRVHHLVADAAERAANEADREAILRMRPDRALAPPPPRWKRYPKPSYGWPYDHPGNAHIEPQFDEPQQPNDG